jgi:uncharacterized protein (DUF952 family)/GNAT superfamily N-acetyltransferase
MKTPCIYHIVARRDWETGPDPWAPPGLATEGFIHCSYHHQVGPTLHRFFAGPDGTLPEGLSVLEIDPFLTGAVVRAEAGTGGEMTAEGRPELFPHLYGELPRAAVTAVRPVTEFVSYVIEVGEYTITDDRGALSLDRAASWLAGESYWAQGRSRKTVAASLENSWVLTVVAPDGSMAGMGRAVTDWATMYYLADLFILPEHRGRGLGKALVRAFVEYPRLVGLKGLLRTKDAHGLYEQFGFERDGEDSNGMRRAPGSGNGGGDWPRP